MVIDKRLPSSIASSLMTHMDFFSNPMFFTALALIASLVAIQILARKLSKDKRKKKYHPIAGTSFHQLLNFNRLHHYMTDLAGKYRTYRLLNPSRYEVYTSDPENVEYILKTNFENYGKVCLSSHRSLAGSGNAPPRATYVFLLTSHLPHALNILLSFFFFLLLRIEDQLLARPEK
jgi:hypothetical protein